MARILVSGPSSVFVGSEFQFAVFYEGFIKSLLKCGNDVRAINSSNFLNKSWHGYNATSWMVDDRKLVNDIRDFDPELIIAFNHSIPQVILNNTDCKIAVWDADSIQFYNDKQYIKDNIARYIFLCFSVAGLENARQFGAGADQTHLLLAGTGIEAQDVPQDKNISFIGTRFRVPDAFISLLRKEGSARVLPVLDELRQQYYTDHHEILRRHKAEHFEDYVDAATLASLYSTQKRNSLLNDLQELGLTIYGTLDWYDVGGTLPWLAMSYNAKQVYSLKHNQDIYNSSKICVNISHSHAVDGFPWRVMDIMASNGCLVSDKKSGLSEFTKDYVDIPMYESRQEAFDLCQRLLRDDIWRREVVAGSQRCIAEKGRWESRFKELSAITNLALYQPRPAGSNEDEAQNLESAVLRLKQYQPFYAAFFFNLSKRAISLVPRKMYGPIYKTLSALGIKIPYVITCYAQHKKLQTES